MFFVLIIRDSLIIEIVPYNFEGPNPHNQPMD